MSDTTAPEATEAASDTATDTDAYARVVYPATETKTVPAVYAAICEAMNAIGAVAKGTHSDHGNFKFRGIDDALNVVGPVLRSYCLFISPRLVSITRTQLKTNAGGGLVNTIVEVAYDFISGADGSVHTVGPIPGEGMDTGDKSTAKAMSVAMRTMLWQVFAIPTQDRDPDHDVYEIAGSAPSHAPGRQATAKPRQRPATEVDPWADDNPERVAYYADAIRASGNDGSLRLVWEEIAASCKDGTLSKKDGDHLSQLTGTRRTELAAAAEAAREADPEHEYHTA